MDARASRSSSAQPMARVAGVTRDSSIQRTRESSVNPAGSTTPAPNVPSAFTSNHRTSVSSCISQSTVQRRAPKRIHSQASSVLVSITSASGDALHEPNLLIPDALDNDLQNMAHPGLDPVSPRVISKAIFDLGSASEMDSPRNMSTVDLDKSPFAASSFNSESVSLMKRPSSWAPAPHDIPAGLAPAPPHLAHSKSLASQISSYSQQSKAGTAETSRGKHSRSTTPGTASTANTGTTKETVREHQKAADAKNNHVYSNATLGSSSTYKCDEGGWEGFGQAACTKALKERLDRITLWTKQTPLPSIYTTMKEWRFIFRVAQVALTCASFTGLAVGTFRANYMSSVLSTAGINYMAFTAIASMFVSTSWIVVYTNPATLGIPPHKHPRISRVELAIDFYFLLMWLSASVQLAMHAASACPSTSAAYCITWDLSIFFGYCCVAAFSVMVAIGATDLRAHNWGFGGNDFRRVEARGGWAPPASVAKEGAMSELDD